MAHESEVFKALQTGEKSALRILYRQHQRAVYWAAYSVLPSRPDAEEILQDTFLTLWNKRSSIILVGQSTLPWLVTTARYLAQNRRRSETRHRIASSVETDILDDENSPEQIALAAELVRQIDVILAKTSPLDSELFRLCMLDDLSYKQAAHQLGVTHATVRNRLARLRARFRIELDVLRGGDR